MPPTKKRFKILELLGKGTFGKVFLAIDNKTGKKVAVKRTAKWKNKISREAQQLETFKNCSNKYYIRGHHQDSIRKTLLWNLLKKLHKLLAIYHSLGSFIRRHKDMKPNTASVRIPPKALCNIICQISRGITKLHQSNVAHRDLKPENILIQYKSPSDIILKLCDFGSAKNLANSPDSIPYVCSRWYRAPELLFGSLKYSVAVDLWSLGCIIAELVLLRPIFPGQALSTEKSTRCGADEPYQLVEIMKVIGSPSAQDIAELGKGIPAEIKVKVQKLCNAEVKPVPLLEIVQKLKLLQEE
ncbi:putative cell-cycle-associated protein kinase GSK [Cardiosporidium cionae]|uniref:Cell-cycle-associated protein kinase GSK n=1 Tax=Cardiosporidium cionae TaxID=476202 RepID=A0ABQ7J811_9APIC|nr:putative cell-cycle-associated protein kinase GSK [Cardiosporidium cionae]|eukprot:KAF8820111.1 putative cell-cycle-associated protein kinase GSK [Cardiosporidium cionae]